MQLSLVKELKDNEQDFEFYPTTPEIIHIIKRNIGTDRHPSILDCGAGDGETLTSLTEGRKYAIEKSQILVTAMSPDIFVVGCDFFENSLIDKKVDVVFSNPPYSQYKDWAVKIINESNAADIYLVIPERWKNQPEIQAAIDDRKAKATVIGNTTFLEADRPARAKVDIIKITLRNYRRSYQNNSTPDVDPFILWVEKEFPINSRTVDTPGMSSDESFQNKINELVPGRGRVAALVTLYQNELRTLQENFLAISKIDHSIFAELQIDFKSITEFLRNRIKGLKEKYWRELFTHLDPITSRLTNDSRTLLLATLTDNVSVDFTESNIYAVTTWAIKNANKYLDQQLVDVFMSLSDQANLIKYKSNQSTWGNDCWRFREDLREGRVKNFGLDYRCVLSFHNTFSTESYMRYDYENGLHKNANSKINDIITIANNLGFSCPTWENSSQKEWEPGKAHDFYMNRAKGEILMSVRAYKNGNIHFKFNQKFLRKLNVEFGRLKGWLRNYEQAADELNISKKEAKQYFKSNFVLEGSATLKLIA
jgi:predicted RNA methylase